MSAPVSMQIVLGLLMFVAVYVPLERLFPFARQSPFRPGWATDITYYIAGCFVGRCSDALSVGGMLLIRQATGLGPAHAVATQPGWLQVLEILLLADFLAYWFHRTIHRCRFLWRFHRVHHSSPQMDWLTNVHLHPIDKALGDCFQFIPIFLIGFSDGAVLAYTICLGFQGFLNHSNIRVYYGPLRWVIASPQFHHWHHCDQPEAYNKNLSPHLVIFDLLFGTFYLPPDRSLPQNYGAGEPVPDGFWRQLVFPFEGLARLGRKRQEAPENAASVASCKLLLGRAALGRDASSD